MIEGTQLDPIDRGKVCPARGCQSKAMGYSWIYDVDSPEDEIYISMCMYHAGVVDRLIEIREQLPVFRSWWTSLRKRLKR